MRFLLLLLFLLLDSTYGSLEFELIRRTERGKTLTVDFPPQKPHVGKKTAVGVCLLTAGHPNCSTHEELETIVQLGTPGQSFRLQLDFTSDRLWVFDSAVRLSNRTRKFEKSRSKTFMADGEDAHISFEGRNLSSRTAMDILIMNDSTIPVDFSLVQRVPRGFRFESDGIFGVAPSNSTDGILSSLLRNETKKFVTIFVNPNERSEAAGRLSIGGLDHENCDSAWNFVRLAPAARGWTAVAKKIKLGNETMGRNHEIRLNPAALITFAPKWIAAEIHEKIGAVRHSEGTMFVVRAKNASELPVLSLQFNGHSIRLSGDQYTTASPLLPKDQRLVTIFGFYEDPRWELGRSFFRSHCAALDVRTKRLGFAKINAAPKTLKLQELASSSNSPVIPYFATWILVFCSSFFL